MVIPGIGGERAFNGTPGPHEGILIPRPSPPATTPIQDMSMGLAGLSGPPQFSQNPLWKTPPRQRTNAPRPLPFLESMQKMRNAMDVGGMNAGLATLTGAA